jgi:hypothetical protein
MEQESLVQNKVLLLECFVAESKLASFLFDCMGKHASGLDLQETLKARELINNVYGLLQRIKVSADESPPPDKLPVYRPGGVRARDHQYHKDSQVPNGSMSVICWLLVAWFV